MIHLFLVDLFGSRYSYRFQEMTFGGFLGMCALLVLLLIISRLLGKTSTNGSFLKKENLSNYTLGFEVNEDSMTYNNSEKKVSTLTKVVIILVVIVLIFSPISLFIKTIDPNYLWF